MDMSRISELNERFDFVYSSLAFHYIMDFPQFVSDIYRLINDGGELLFSQEHPIATATAGGLGHYNENQAGEYVSYTMSDYGRSGKKGCALVCGRRGEYHRTVSEIVNALAGAGFMVKEMREPLPDAQALKILRGWKKEFIKPSFLIIKAKK